MELKNYQKRTLSVLTRFFETARIHGSETAFNELVQNDPEIARQLNGVEIRYSRFDDETDIPSVCLKIPTGGGKTLLAAYAIKITAQKYRYTETPLVLWFTPSNTIREQTVDALKNPRHPYRVALDEQFDGHVKVFDIDEKFNITPTDLAENMCIVVTTNQAFNRRNKDGLKVYQTNENLENHFASGIAEDGMDRDENGKIFYSFANILYHHRPIMIVDEAHNALTDLNLETRRKLNPSAIVEFTATPRIENRLCNNLLYSVPALDLKNEEMIKLPIDLDIDADWESLIAKSIVKRQQLEEEAKKTEDDYIRPILLIQAQNNNNPLSPENVKKYLIENSHIPEDEIKIVTAEQKDLDGINLFDAACPVKYVITIEALREGWDCAFAYVLCSLQENINARTAITQLLGRVMRMPYARKRKSELLNHAYAYVCSNNFNDAVDALVGKLSEKGFDDISQLQLIHPLTDDNNFFGDSSPNRIMTKSVIPPSVIDNSIKVQKETDGRTTLILTPETTKEAVERIYPHLSEKEQLIIKTKFDNLHRHPIAQTKFPVSFKLPRYCLGTQTEFDFRDASNYFDDFEWQLKDYTDYELDDFFVQKTGHRYQIDLNSRGDRLNYTATQADELPLGEAFAGWDESHLVHWLDKQLKKPYLIPSELTAWLVKVVHYLVSERKMSVADLMICRFVLASVLNARIENALVKAKKAAYQMTFWDKKQARLSDEHAFVFDKNMYGQCVDFYNGQYAFQKHYLGNDRIPNLDTDEEIACAQTIDSMDEVDFWMRNLAKNPNSFYLPTWNDKFYPDFIVKLKDGRILLVEYKGSHLWSNDDSEEKRLIGAVWEKDNNGKNLFLMIQGPERRNSSVSDIVRNAIKEKIRASA